MPLHSAASFDQSEVVKLLLEFGAEKEVKIFHGCRRQREKWGELG